MAGDVKSPSSRERSVASLRRALRVMEAGAMLPRRAVGVSRKGLQGLRGGVLVGGAYKQNTHDKHTNRRQNSSVSAKE